MEATAAFAHTAGDADWEAIELAKRDQEAFGDLYDRYCGQIYRFVSGRVNDPSMAEDITEEVFFKALRNIKGYRHMGLCFSSWLYRIACHAVADHYRGHRAEFGLEEAEQVPDHAGNVLDEVVRRDRSRQIWKAIDRLPAQQRAAMILKFSDDLRLEEIGRIMGKVRPRSSSWSTGPSSVCGESSLIRSPRG